MSKQLSNVGAPGEEPHGFSQAVRSGDTVFRSGQTASGPGSDAGPADLADLAERRRRAYAEVTDALAPSGAGPDDAAVRVARAVRREACGGRPAVASMLVEPRRLVAPELLVEVGVAARLDG